MSVGILARQTLDGNTNFLSLPVSLPFTVFRRVCFRSTKFPYVAQELRLAFFLRDNGGLLSASITTAVFMVLQIPQTHTYARQSQQNVVSAFSRWKFSQKFCDFIRILKYVMNSEIWSSPSFFIVYWCDVRKNRVSVTVFYWVFCCCYWDTRWNSYLSLFFVPHKHKH